MLKSSRLFNFLKLKTLCRRFKRKKTFNFQSVLSILSRIAIEIGNFRAEIISLKLNLKSFGSKLPQRFERFGFRRPAWPVGSLNHNLCSPQCSRAQLEIWKPNSIVKFSRFTWFECTLEIWLPHRFGSVASSWSLPQTLLKALPILEKSHFIEVTLSRLIFEFSIGLFATGTVDSNRPSTCFCATFSFEENSSSSSRTEADKIDQLIFWRTTFHAF